MSAAYELVHFARPWSVNDERRRHHMVIAERTREWRDAFNWLARKEKVPRFDVPVVITVMAVFSHGRRQDVGNCYPAVKAAIDGLRDAGVLVDDSDDYVASIVFVRPETGRERDALVLRIEAL